ncbi:MAG: DUF423 domain-containing protein [Caldithrix sp.]|nr:DUF423 domain-containing protein [Caldithrix sp.]
MYKTWLILFAVFGFLSVAIGAFGAHGLKSILDDYGKSIFETGVQYQMFHSLALLAVGVLQYQFKIASLNKAGWAFTAGIVLFSFSLYILAVTGFKWLGAITPIGGLCFLFGWVWLLYQFLKN